MAIRGIGGGPQRGHPRDRGEVRREAAKDPDILSTLPVVDRELSHLTPNGRFWHRAAIAGTGNEGFMLPEQVWEDSGEDTLSATPLAWTHAQFVRLAWSIVAGRTVEQPSIVACRHTKECR